MAGRLGLRAGAACAALCAAAADPAAARINASARAAGGGDSSAWLRKPEPAVSVVHVINSCHLDIGFADTAQNIVNDYFDKHLPLAASVGAQLRDGVTNFTDSKLNFMFHSWVLDMYFNCPPGMGLHCPSAKSKANISAAIASGDITWQAFPHNAEPAIMDPALIKAGLAMTFALDDKFGQPHKGVLSQRDVPGLARALIPILKGKGVRGISIGAHEDSKHAAKVPPCFVWRDAASNTSVIMLYTWPGYGSLPLSNERVCIVDGAALVYNWAGDNHGPYNADGYGSSWTKIAQSFPNATIVASTLDNFTQHLMSVEEQLPVVDQEIADDWIYGVASGEPSSFCDFGAAVQQFTAVDSMPRQTRTRPAACAWSTAPTARLTAAARWSASWRATPRCVTRRGSSSRTASECSSARPGLRPRR